ncbi:SBF-like CPA transporter family-domain-containing protein [Gongronella butleri]|nr:SBF-like CPA transporter family-domain-containing protein [Gongronella butleri]
MSTTTQQITVQQTESVKNCRLSGSDTPTSTLHSTTSPPSLRSDVPESLPSEASDKTTVQLDKPSLLLRVRRTAWSLFVKYWFLLGLGLMFGLAWAFPQVGKTDGSVQAQYSVKWGAVVVIFLLSGLALDVKVMLKNIIRWRLHLTVQIINFIVLPFFAYGIVRFFIAVHANIDPIVYQGWIIALSTSTTVSSNSVMTRSAGGNDSAAVVNAAIGNILGIFISPALMTIFGDDSVLFPPGSARGKPDYTHILFQLGLTVLVPLIVGQVIRYFFPDIVKKLAQKLKFSIINSIALLIMVWSVVCDGVATRAFYSLSAVDIVAIIFVDIGLYLVACAFCILVARLPWPFTRWDEPAWLEKWRFSREDAVAIMYCGATKTVSMGIPLINVLYSSTSSGVVGVLSLPLLLYHISQLFLGNFQVPFLKKWIQHGKEEDNMTLDGSQADAADNISLPSYATRRRTTGPE